MDNKFDTALRSLQQTVSSALELQGLALNGALIGVLRSCNEPSDCGVGVRIPFGAGVPAGWREAGDDGAKIKRGSVVQLKSGGPRMTVAAMGGDNYTHSGLARVVRPDCVLCHWFSRETLCTEQIPLSSLAPVPSGEGKAEPVDESKTKTA